MIEYEWITITNNKKKTIILFSENVHVFHKCYVCFVNTFFFIHLFSINRFMSFWLKFFFIHWNQKKKNQKYLFKNCIEKKKNEEVGPWREKLLSFFFFVCYLKIFENTIERKWHLWFFEAIDAKIVKVSKMKINK